MPRSSARGTRWPRSAADGISGEQTARARRELAAIVGGTERATQSILQAAEEIDQAAHTLAASLKGGHDQGLAHDIQDRVVQIFEACNFQDLTGQRVTHVLETLKFVEEHVGAAAGDLARRRAVHAGRVRRGRPAATGASSTGRSLPEDRGHSSQDDIDTMFDAAPDPEANSAA